MAITSKPSSSESTLDETPCKIKVRQMRMWKAGRTKKPGNLVEFLLLEPSGAKIQTTIDEAFSKWIMDISDEKIDNGDAGIQIYEASLPEYYENPIEETVRDVYGRSFAEPEFCHDTGIFCNRDSDVDKINDYMLSLLPGEEKLCYGDDCLPPRDEYKSSPSDYMLLAPTAFGSCIVPGVPPQVLRLKVGAPVMLLADIDPSRGLLTGTRLQITKLGDSMLEARFAACDNDGEKIEKFLIPKTHMFPTENFSGALRRTQFPLKLAFAMALNKNHGQRLSRVGLYLPRRALSHGKRFLALSKMNSGGTCYKVLIIGEDEKPQEQVENVVFKDLFENV